MFDKQRSDNQKHQLQLQLQPVTNSLNVLTCLLVTLLLLFEGHTIQATPITRLRQQQQQQQYQSQSHQQHANHRQQQQHFQERNGRDCEHKSLVELIKTSPIVIKALGAHIFTNDDDEDFHILQKPEDAFVTSWQQSGQTEFAALHKGISSASSPESASSSARGSKSTTTPFNADAVLITLTPDTIYKGASLLKTATNAAIAATSTRRSGSSNADNSDGANDSDFAPYSSSESSVEGQLNATIQPLSCFDGNLLKTLPTDLIIFGKLITIDQQQQTKHSDLINAQQGYTGTSSSSSSSSSLAAEAASAPYSTSHQQQQIQRPKDILQISVNGLHRWSSQLESYIWTHLGWDDWSDFTVCSVACGKGVQQRFRRCLLDNPMVNMKMNFNEIAEEELHEEEEALEVEQEVEEYDDNDHNRGDDGAYVDGDDIDANEEKQYDDIDRMIFEDDDDDELIDQLKAIDNYDSAITSSLDSATEDYVGYNEAFGSWNENENAAKPVATHKKHRRAKLSPTVANQDSILHRADVFEMDNNMLHFVTSRPVAKSKRVTKHRYVTPTAMTTTEEPEIMRIFEGDFNDVYSEKIYNESPFNSETREDNKKDVMPHRKGQRSKHKRHKSAKIVSTMFCEGYNIEQRDCNTFECSDDINDLLKFYRKYSTTEDTSTASTQPFNADLYTAAAAALPSSSSSSSSASSSSLALSASTAAGNSLSVPLSSSLLNELGTWNSMTETYNQNSNTITPTPMNTGFVQTWHNLLNFTIMLTIRAKNDSYNASAQSSKAAVTSTIFSIRNGSQHLYLETYRDGLRLYLERDKTTEMLPIQFNLYDYRWHQVAISIKNGDFISIYIDCSWTNSFVVSSRMFSLPLESDVEIGRGFNGELQQLLILPGLQGRRQCSDKRISINEVKRYIIDTFIGDYGN